MPDLVFRITSNEPAPLNSPLGPLPAGFSGLLARCLRKHRNERFQSVGELARALAPFGDHLALASADRICTIVGEPEPPKRFDAFDTQQAFSATAPEQRAWCPGDQAPSPAPTGTGDETIAGFTPITKTRWVVLGLMLITLAALGIFFTFVHSSTTSMATSATPVSDEPAAPVTIDERRATTVPIAVPDHAATPAGSTSLSLAASPGASDRQGAAQRPTAEISNTSPLAPPRATAKEPRAAGATQPSNQSQHVGVGQTPSEHDSKPAPIDTEALYRDRR